MFAIRTQEFELPAHLTKQDLGCEEVIEALVKVGRKPFFSTDPYYAGREPRRVLGACFIPVSRQSAEEALRHDIITITLEGGMQFIELPYPEIEVLRKRITAAEAELLQTPQQNKRGILPNLSD